MYLGKDEVRQGFLAALAALVRNAVESRAEVRAAGGVPAEVKGMESFEDYTATVSEIVQRAGYADPLAPPELAGGGAEDEDEMRELLIKLASEAAVDTDFDRQEMVEAARRLEASDPSVGVTVADARWMKPLDTELIDKLAKEHDVLITVEENAIGGFGDHVLHYLALSGALDQGTVKVRPMVLPDKYIEAANQSEQYEEAGLTSEYIENTARTLLGKSPLQKQAARKQNEDPTIA